MTQASNVNTLTQHTDTDTEQSQHRIDLRKGAQMHRTEHEESTGQEYAQKRFDL